MRNRKRRLRVDWDEEIRKTERIRRRGFFISALGLGVAVLFTFGGWRFGGSVGMTEIVPKILFALFLALSSALCLVLAAALARVVPRVRERLRQGPSRGERPGSEHSNQEEK